MNGVVEPSGTETLSMLHILLSLIIIQTTYSSSYIFKIIFEDIYTLYQFNKVSASPTLLNISISRINIFCLCPNHIHTLEWKSLVFLFWNAPFTTSGFNTHATNCKYKKIYDFALHTTWNVPRLITWKMCEMSQVLLNGGKMSTSPFINLCKESVPSSFCRKKQMPHQWRNLEFFFHWF